MKADGDPNLIVYFDGQYMPLGEARVGILTHALHYGTGVFEGIRAHWDEAQQELFVLRAQEHYERWIQNCGILRIAVPRSAEQLCEITVELMRRNAFRTNVYVRPLAYKCAERVGVSSWRRIEDNAIPARAKICGAYVNSALASDEAHQCGFDEAIFLNESGHVAEGATCNIFMVRKGRLITPPVTENVLEGITRDTVMELARRELGLQVVERPIDRSELYVCDELFFTGTAVGVAPIVRVDHRPVKDGAIGAISREIRQSYVDATRGRMRNYWNWLTPVYHSRAAREQDHDSLVGVTAD